MVKTARRNSNLSGLSYLDLPISSKTFNKYMKILKTKGLIRNNKIISLREIFLKLQLGDGKDYYMLYSKSIHGYWLFVEGKTINEVCQWLKIKSVQHLLRKQRHHLKKDYNLYRAFQQGDYKTAVKLVGRTTQSMEETKQEVLQKGIPYVKTGSRHIEKNLGINHQTANKILAKFNGRVISKTFIKMEVCHASFHYLKEIYSATAIIPCTTGFMVVEGSRFYLDSTISLVSPL